MGRRNFETQHTAIPERNCELGEESVKLTLLAGDCFEIAANNPDEIPSREDEFRSLGARERRADRG
jgi:hypothetical protein